MIQEKNKKKCIIKIIIRKSEEYNSSNHLIRFSDKGIDSNHLKEKRRRGLPRRMISSQLVAINERWKNQRRLSRRLYRAHDRAHADPFSGCSLIARFSGSSGDRRSCHGGWRWKGEG